MGRRVSSLLLFVAGYLALALLGPLAAAPALTSFVAATLLLAREREPVRI